MPTTGAAMEREQDQFFVVCRAHGVREPVDVTGAATPLEVQVRVSEEIRKHNVAAGHM